MKKKILLMITFSFSVLSFAQVGIKTDNPNLSSDLELGSNNKTLLLNRVPTTASVANPVNGMMIYDQSEECVKAYQNGKWSKCLGKGLSGKKTLMSSVSLLCNSATISPNPVAGQPFKGTLTIPYTGGNGGSYGAQSIQANGLTAILPVGNFALGNGTLQYSVTGTPDRTGNITFNTNIAGNTCSVASK
ncbi:hypothetical protein BBH99_03380 [Chryseobacterium contaminans]|uniref:Uncharacterized protein n=1 Tax=Chryseobacterium contaminans TaxID=1423959 RepID=A0A1M6VDE3_9FLAO|nr:hypothetical protein [Chryseobacterium contaminans]OCA71090.1 hypothetical protein BBH99_03380 [Chryseobacterium contaminans]SHK79365.1 hypothetical protein SAMN05444407_101166 [Chryseobacterium contaminans]